MGDKAETITSRSKYTKTEQADKQILAFTVEDVSTNDTITISDIPASPGIATAMLWKRADGATVSCTVATNVITVTEAGLSSVDLAGCVSEK